MALNRKQILALFETGDGGELRYRDIMRILDLHPGERKQLKLLLAGMVSTDLLRLRKGRWYRRGEGEFTASVPNAMSAQKRRQQIYRELYNEEKLPVEFSSTVRDHAESVPDAVTEIPDGYEDFRELPLVTIDPPDARDFDDAVMVMPLQSGAGYRLVVAIADVSAYVTPGSPMDREAYLRGTSVYLPGTVVPMLPHRLSNGICSLKPGENRLAFAALLDYAPGARLLGARFTPCVIRSRAALAYGDAQKILDGATPEGVDADVLASFGRMKKLFEDMLKNRKARGSVDLDIPEPKVWIGENGEIERIEKAPRFAAHRLIEEFMVAANSAVAHYLGKRELPALYRVHGEPSEERLEQFAGIARTLGFAFDPNDAGPKAINAFLKSIKNADEAAYLNILLLRSFKQAVYSDVNEGHFGLALEYYSHFTSPIRRYPDLEIHRLLKRALAGYRDEGEKLAVAHRNERIAEQCSSNEQRAVKVERRALSVCQAEYMERFIGDRFEGRISGVSEYGFWVQIADPFVEGMVHVSRLPDFFRYEEDSHALVGDRSGRRFRLGDDVEIKLISVDIPKGFIDFELTGDDAPTGKPRRGQPKARRKPANVSRPSSPRRWPGKAPRKGTSAKKSRPKPGAKPTTRKAAPKGKKSGRR